MLIEFIALINKPGWVLILKSVKSFILLFTNIHVLHIAMSNYTEDEFMGREQNINYFLSKGMFISLLSIYVFIL